MTQLLTEEVKIDIGLLPQALNNTNATGKWFSLRDYRRATAILLGGAMAATKTTKIEFLQAQDSAGTGAKAVSGKEQTITANASVIELTLTLATVLAGQSVTVNGITFTAHASTTTAANREFSIGGTDDADATALAGLINDPVYGVPGVVASVASNVITLRGVEPGAVLVTASASAATVTVATTEHRAAVELSHFDLDSAGGFKWVAVKVTTTANTNVGAGILRGHSRAAMS